MPRTKRPVKKPEKAAEDDESKKLDKFVKDQKIKVDKLAEMEIRNIDIAFKIWLGSLSAAGYLERTIRDLKSELVLNEATNTRATRHSSRTASHDDGYLTENSSQGSGERGAKKQFAVPKSTSRPAHSTMSRRSRSADTSTRKPPSTSTKCSSHRRRSRSVYRTPAYNKNSNYNYPVITPKVVPNTPVALLRQPRQGEMVVSMSGSPVMMPTGYTMQPNMSEKASCNILLEDGTMMFLQPQQLRHSQTYIPYNLMDSKVIQQLKTLKDNLDTVVKLDEELVLLYADKSSLVCADR